jgi:hypothetical protein
MNFIYLFVTQRYDYLLEGERKQGEERRGDREMRWRG